MHHESRTKDLRPAALKPRPQRMTAEPELAVADAGRADPENRILLMILLLLPLDSPTRLQPAQPLLPRRDACVRKAPKGRVWQRDVREGVPCRVREDQGRTPIFGRGCRADLIRALWLRAAGMPIGGFVATAKPFREQGCQTKESPRRWSWTRHGLWCMHASAHQLNSTLTSGKDGCRSSVSRSAHARIGVRRSTHPLGGVGAYSRRRFRMRNRVLPQPLSPEYAARS